MEKTDDTVHSTGRAADRWRGRAASRNGLTFVVTVPEEPRFIGIVGLKDRGEGVVEMIYGIAPHWRGHGTRAWRAGVAQFRELPSTAERNVMLCTDLHAGNVLAAQREPWLVIDPKPYAGIPPTTCSSTCSTATSAWQQIPEVSLSRWLTCSARNPAAPPVAVRLAVARSRLAGPALPMSRAASPARPSQRQQLARGHGLT